MAQVNYNPNIQIVMPGGTGGSGGGGSGAPTFSPQNTTSPQQEDFADVADRTQQAIIEKIISKGTNPINAELNRMATQIVPLARTFQPIGGILSNIIVSLGRIAYGVGRVTPQELESMGDDERKAYIKDQALKLAEAKKMALVLGKVTAVAAAVIGILTLSKLFRTLMGTVFQIISLMMDIFVIPLIPIFIAIFQVLIKHIPNIMDFGKRIGKMMERTAPIWEAITELIMLGAEMTMQMIEAILPFLSPVLKGIGMISTALIQALSSWLSFTTNASSWIPKLIELFTTIGVAVTTFLLTAPLEFIIGFLKGLESSISNVSALSAQIELFTSKIWVFVEQMLAWVREKGEGFGKFISDQLANMEKGIGLLPALLTTMEIVANFFDKNKDAMASVMQNILDAGLSIATAILQWDMAGLVNNVVAITNAIAGGWMGGLLGVKKEQTVQIAQKATGGYIPQNTLAMLHAGEFVIPKSGVQNMLSNTQNFNVGGSSFAENVSTSRMLSQAMKDALSENLLRNI